MERPALQPLRRIASQHLPLTPRRTQATASRTRKALKIQPHESFLGRSTEDHIIFNPPSSAPSVYHTPFKFLPRTDPRRQANLTQLIRASSSSSTSAAGAMPVADIPEVGTQPNGGFVLPKHNVTKEQVEEMRALRALDPTKWSVAALAKKFECTNWFVMMCCKATPEHKASEQARLEAIKARWGPIRTKAREDRQKRKAMLGRGEL
ncbi:mitochondrial ribosomal protein subunit L20-domain-containing protein [Pestalotiopsis sp. NC0098]|nr:mitochondrial ribosomal protein subunit L20-domain-containing protein [Pestalotiopsis sp. NC0098]